MKDLQTFYDFSGTSYDWISLIKEIKNYNEKGFKIYIGSDTKIIKEKISLATIICPHKQGTSGKVFYIKEKFNRNYYPNLKSRMFLEAYRSLELAQEIQEFCKNKIEVHLDIGETLKSKTSIYENELKSMILSQGFDCAIKPESFASFAADKILKGLTKLEVVTF